MLIYAFILLFLIGLFGVLSLRYLRTARNALKTGSVEGALVGRNRYTRVEDPAIFWTIFCAGVLGAAVGATVLICAIFVFASAISAYLGYPTL